MTGKEPRVQGRRVQEWKVQRWRAEGGGAEGTYHIHFVVLVFGVDVLDVSHNMCVQSLPQELVTAAQQLKEEL